MIVEDNLHFTTERKKLTPEDFIRKYEKILNKAKKLINSVVDKDTVRLLSLLRTFPMVIIQKF